MVNKFTKVFHMFFNCIGDFGRLRVIKTRHYDEACFMHLTPGVVHNFPKAGGV